MYSENPIKKISDSASLTASWYTHLIEAVWSHVTIPRKFKKGHRQILKIWDFALKWSFLGTKHLSFPDGNPRPGRWGYPPSGSPIKWSPERVKQIFYSATSYLGWTDRVLAHKDNDHLGHWVKYTAPQVVHIGQSDGHNKSLQIL